MCSGYPEPTGTDTADRSLSRGAAAGTELVSTFRFAEARAEQYRDMHDHAVKSVVNYSAGARSVRTCSVIL